jgi:DNA invertase Pin-like site-specific DNA recombinase
VHGYEQTPRYAFKEFERAMIVARVIPGLARAKAKEDKRILRLYKGGTGILKIGKALGIGTGTVQRVLMEQPRTFEVDVAEAAFASQ